MSTAPRCTATAPRCATSDGSTEQASPRDVLTRAWQPKFLLWTVALVRNGGLTHEGIPTAQPLTEEVAAGLPGAPQVIATPGHTGGHCSYLVDGVLVSGDALVTDHPVAPRPGPQLLPSLFNHDEDACRRSLDVLASVQSEVLLPGHGPVWRGPVAEAARGLTPLTPGCRSPAGRSRSGRGRRRGRSRASGSWCRARRR